MATDAEIEEAAMVAAGIPPERAAAEAWIVGDFLTATSHHTALNDAAADQTDLERRRARANLTAALLAAHYRGLSAGELRAECSAAFAEVFAADGSLRDLEGTYGWRPRDSGDA